MRYLLAVSVAIVAFFLTRPAEAVTFCIPSATTLCIDDQPGDGRFQVQVTYQTTQGGGFAGNARAIPLSSLGVTHGGLMWFFSADNPELLIKILSDCTGSGKHWVFASAGTNVGVTITITDVGTGAQRVYTNPDVHPMTPIQDTAGFACVPVNVDPLLAKTQLLIGHWHFAYTIITTFTDDYTLTNIDGTKNSEGGYFITGTDQFGGPVLASYFPKEADWALLDPGTIIDKFYTFHTDGTTILPGSCYYQVNPPGSTNLSSCYPLSGVKMAGSATALAPQDSRLKTGGDTLRLREQESDLEQDMGQVPAATIEKYLLLKGLIP